MNKSKIMKAAHVLFNSNYGEWSDCLKKAWLDAQFDSVCAMCTNITPCVHHVKRKILKANFNGDIVRYREKLKKELGYSNTLQMRFAPAV
ncbi:MAG: hypothetical protein LBI03_01815 [Clostridiales bacterium]|jgi:hypothetical protein|nr:hypothetical protein [Clostridiales bacterium]